MHDRPFSLQLETHILIHVSSAMCIYIGRIVVVVEHHDGTWSEVTDLPWRCVQDMVTVSTVPDAQETFE